MQRGAIAIGQYAYHSWTRQVFGTEIPVPGVHFAASFSPESTWGHKVHNALIQVELEYVDQLLTSVRDHNVKGAIAEFDSRFWREGTYSASRQVVERNVAARERPRIRLFEGVFAESLLPLMPRL